MRRKGWVSEVREKGEVVMKRFVHRIGCCSDGGDWMGKEMIMVGNDGAVREGIENGFDEGGWCYCLFR